MATIAAICISVAKGTQKTTVPQAELQVDHGIVGDAHAGNWHRQVSLLSYERIAAFNAQGADVVDGAFGENLVVEGFDFSTLPVGTRFVCGEVILEMTQIGKECHNHCEIHKKMGTCIMPTQGVFAKVIHGGKIAVGDTIERIEAVAK